METKSKKNAALRKAQRSIPPKPIFIKLSGSA